MRLFAALVSLGCVKNLVDSETMIPQLENLGYEMTSDFSAASLLVVNTCGFLESAVEEGVQHILNLGFHKQSGSCELLVVTGCLVQRYGKKLLDLMPEVDLFLGTSYYAELENILRARGRGNSRRLWISTPNNLLVGTPARVRSTGDHSAYVKIADGCDNRCSFCLIPHLRGSYRSRSVSDVMSEASELVAYGVKEINIVAQDTTAFGTDRGERNGLVRLIESLDALSGLLWLRILYAYPDRIDDLLLRTMAQSQKVVPYLDLPLQHCAPHILKAMGRTGSSLEVQDLIWLIRSHIPHIALRTSLIVGFPGETEEDFQSLVSFVERMELNHVGVFAFSAETGVRAAKFPNQVETAIKEERRSALLDIQRGVSRRILSRLTGRLLPVLVEGFHPESDLLLVGRLPTQAPDVDGTVIITKGAGHVGDIVPARITDSHDYDVEAELL